MAELTPQLTKTLNDEIDEMIRCNPSMRGMKFELFNFAVKVVEMTTPDDIQQYHSYHRKQLEHQIAFLKGNR